MEIGREAAVELVYDILERDRVIFDGPVANILYSVPGEVYANKLLPGLAERSF